jgi:long-chain fatty acid transport protein
MKHALFAIGLAAFLHVGAARAGGFEQPDLGAQALGRGGAFSARADDGLALHYNVAGLARQRGTKLMLNFNVVLNNFNFQRAGAYAQDPKDPRAWSGSPFPLVRNTGGPGALPALVASSDFGTERFTAALGVFTPAVIRGRTFPASIGNAMPSPARYDAAGSGSTLILYPTLGAAYRITKTLDIGASAAVGFARVNASSIGLVDTGGCSIVEDVKCEARDTFKGSAAAFTGSVGALFRPVPALQFGLQAKLPTVFELDGESTSGPASNASRVPASAPSAAKITLKLPWVIRGGARYIKLAGTKERYDLELDFTYEAWSGAQGEGIRTVIAKTSAGENTQSLTRHAYNNTVSIRGGGAYNLEDMPLTLRAGLFYDSSATAPQYTRIDFDTLAKLGVSAGVGYRYGALTLNAAYAFVLGIGRTVTDGDMRAPNTLKGGQPIGADDALRPAFNNGEYWGSSHVFAFSAEVALESLWGQKPTEWGESEATADTNAKEQSSTPGELVRAPASEPVQPIVTEPTVTPPQKPGKAPKKGKTPKKGKRVR